MLHQIILVLRIFTHEMVSLPVVLSFFSHDYSVCLSAGQLGSLLQYFLVDNSTVMQIRLAIPLAKFLRNNMIFCVA